MICRGEEYPKDFSMMEFFNDHDLNEYEYIIGVLIESENDRNTNTWDCIEVQEIGDVKCFHFPGCIHWLRFRGEWDELYDTLKTSCPKRFKNLQFYWLFQSPGILIK